MVAITANVHVQVPTYGSGLNVVKECEDGTFDFYPIHTLKAFGALCHDLNDALKNG